MMRKKIIILTLLFVGLTIHAQTTYYIDPAGSDASGNGSIENPWKTLYKACNSVITTGDIIHVNAGTYTETAQSLLAVGVSIEGEGDNSHIISHYNVNEYSWLIVGYSASQTNGNQSISYLKFDGDEQTSSTFLGYAAIEFMGRSNVEIHHVTIRDFQANAIMIAGADGKPNTYPDDYSSGCSVHDCTITNCAMFSKGLLSGNVSHGGTIGFEFHDNYLYQPDRGGDNTGEPIGYCKGGFVYGTKFYNNQILGDASYTSTWNGCGEFFECRGGIEIYNNIITGTLDFSANITGESIYSGNYSLNDEGGYGFAIKIYNNQWGSETLPGVWTSGIDIERNVTGGVYIYNNSFKNLHRPITFSYSPGSGSGYFTKEDIYIYYNIFNDIGIANQHSSGDAISTSNRSPNDIMDNLNIWNNTIIGGSAAFPKTGISTYYGGRIINTSIRNNIIVGFEIPILLKNAIGNTISIEDNYFYGNISNTPSYEGSSMTNITEQNNLTTAPPFVSSTDYHLTKSIKGLNVGLTLDYDGVPVGNPPDIGAYEFVCGNNYPPSILNQSFDIAENSPNGTVAGTIVASDSNTNQTLEYSIVSGNTDGAFAINSSTGELSVAKSAAVNVDFALVVKVQDNGTGNLSNQATITINVTPTGIESIGNNSEIKVYPNPVADELDIVVKKNKDRQSFEILDSTGNIVYKGYLSERTVVPTTDFSPGIYFIKLQNGKTFEFKKIIKL